jgi:ketosteroid isomerase-like protein
LADDALNQYAQAWGEPDTKARDALLVRVWAQDGVYQDPSVSLRGTRALSNHIGEFLKQYPNAKITQTTKTDMYGTTYRVGWLLEFGDGTTPNLEGFDYGELDQSGQISKISGFFGPLVEEQTAKNEATVRKYLESLFTKYDYAGLDSVLAPDVVYTQAAGLPYGGIFHGLPEMVKMFMKSSEFSSIVVIDGWQLSTNTITKKVIASFTIRATAKKSGRALDMEIRECFELRDGKIVAITPFYFDTKTFAAFLDEAP